MDAMLGGVLRKRWPWEGIQCDRSRDCVFGCFLVQGRPRMREGAAIWNDALVWLTGTGWSTADLSVCIMKCFECISKIHMHIFYCCSMTVVPIFPISFPCLTHPHIPHSVLPSLLSLSLGPSHMSLDLTSLSFPHCPPRPGHCWFVLYFRGSASVLLTCLLC